MLSIIEFLKEIGWLVRDEDGKNIHRYTTNTTKNVRKKVGCSTMLINNESQGLSI